jgi:hypothetical protein
MWAYLQSVIMPADGISAANWEERRPRYVTVLGQLSDKPCLPIVRDMGCRTQITMAIERIKCWAASVVAPVAGRDIREPKEANCNHQTRSVL